MKQYPVHTTREQYRGTDPRKRKTVENYNMTALRVEQYINSEVAKWSEDTVGIIMSYEVASAISEDSDLVHKIIFGIDGGSNGVTVFKGDYERAMQKRAGLAVGR